ncbi:MAG: hypothetical protein KA293_02620 [Bacteroidia bacterium]|nr:hypothetical protein [Bacteroidota bacterium]MBP6639159.1 hypothetical protein [Bacteroidia bacterium]
MRIKLVTIKEFGGRELPDEFIGDLIDHKPGQAWDSILHFKSDYFDFSHVPEVKIMAGIELARKFGIGETIIKKSGSSDISNALRPEEQISLFPPFR